jgi:trans-aconitate 2-methyltransferase
MNNYHILALTCVVAHTMYSMETSPKKDWKGEQYKRNSALQYNAAMGALSRIPFKDNHVVLDIGCGDGGVTEEIAKKVPQGFVKGIDISPNMIKFAFENHQRDNLCFSLQDISQEKTSEELLEQFKYDNRGYDLITAFSSISWMKNQQTVFTNIARLLAVNGKFRAGLAHEDCAYLRARSAMHTHDTWKEFFVDYTVPYYPTNEEKVTSLLKDVCLKPILVRKIDVPYTFKTKQELIDWMSVIPVQLDRIPEERHQEFLNDIVTEYLKEVSPKEDGSIELLVSAVAIHAELDL